MALDQHDVDKYEWKDGKLVPPVEKEMSFFEHLEELRWHIVRSLIAIVVVGIGLFIFKDWYFSTILLGPTQPDFFSYRFFCDLSNQLGIGNVLCITPPPFKAIAIGFAEAFITAFQMSFVGGFILAFPYVFYEIWRFVSPGLYPKERKATRGVVFICSALFLTGVMFGYFVIAPFAIQFLVGYTIPGVENTPALYSVISYMVMFTLPTGIIFEMPVVVYFLARIGLVTPDGMRQYRRHSIIGILLTAAIITPTPDIATQLLLAIPLYILYEASVAVAGRGQRQYEKDDAEDAAASAAPPAKG
jgi:sec-independent protein translocase protein TatC